MAFNRLHVNDLATATLDDSDQVIIGESNTFKKATVGALKSNILGSSPSYTTDTEPYLMRQTAHTGIVGKCALSKLVGGSLGWNQLCKYPTTQTVSGVTITNNGTKLTLNGTANALITLSLDTLTIPTHIYYADKGSSATNYRLYNYGNGVTTGDEDRYCFGKASGSAALTLRIPSGSTFANSDIVPQAIDLTQMFGSTIAAYIYSLGTTNGMAWLRKYIDIDSYHAYDAGSIQSVQTTAHVTTGKNQYTQGNAQGAIYGSGTEDSNTTRCKTDGYIPVVANQKYTIKTFTTGIYVIGYAFYDGSKNFIQTVVPSSNTNYINTFTSLSNASYVRFTFWKQNNNVTPSEIGNVQLELGETATAYESPVIHTYPLGSDTLRGIPQLVSNKLSYDGDEKYPDGTIKRRYGIANINDLTFTYDSTNKWLMGSSALPNAISSTTSMPNSMTDMPYDAVAANTLNVNTKAWTLYTGKVVVKDSSLTEAQLRAAISGKHIVYPLATETTESSTAYQKVQTIDSDGTESFTTSSPVPVGHETQTPDNVLAALSWVGE